MVQISDYKKQQKPCKRLKNNTIRLKTRNKSTTNEAIIKFSLQA